MKDLTVKDDAGYTQTLTGQISRNIPNTSIYKINKETTATYLIETNPAFTDRKKFLSSDYMYEQMKWDPDKTMKRLGDGFYEQELVRQQIMELKGTRYLPGYTGDEEEYKALMESGAAFARKYDLKPGIELTKEQMAAYRRYRLARQGESHPARRENGRRPRPAGIPQSGKQKRTAP